MVIKVKPELYKLSSKIIKEKTIYFILRSNKTVVNNIYDEDKKKVQAYLDRLVSMGYCRK